MLRHPRFERRKPGGIGAVGLGEQFIARPHRRFVARGMVGVAGLERQHQPVEEAAARARAVGEQTVHRRGQPQHRQPFGERIDRSGRAIDANLAAVRRGGEGAGAQLHDPVRVERSRDTPPRLRSGRTALGRVLQRRKSFPAHRSEPFRSMPLRAARAPESAVTPPPSTLVLPAPLSPVSKTKPGPGSISAAA